MTIIHVWQRVNFRAKDLNQADKNDLGLNIKNGDERTNLLDKANALSEHFNTLITNDHDLNCAGMNRVEHK